MCVRYANGKSIAITLPEDVQKNIYLIKTIKYIRNNIYVASVTYKRNKNQLFVSNLGKGTYSIEYYPRIRRLTDTDLGNTLYVEDTNQDYTDDSLDLSTLGISDEICTAVIPYLVKANIWQEVEPELAQLSRTQGLQNLSYIDQEDQAVQDQVAYSWGGYYE